MLARIVVMAMTALLIWQVFIVGSKPGRGGFIGAKLIAQVFK